MRFLCHRPRGGRYALRRHSGNKRLWFSIENLEATSINYDPKRGILVVQVIFDYQGEQDSERPFSGSSFEIVAKMELLLRDNVWSLVENSLELTSVNSNVDNDWYD